ncbi:hypothetical protein [Nocardioides sp. BYT-33-1]|uniref:hypothetical protein n=1 Tax=Nocardioides sp. BYT-33-1 TaxID=3416952 RepID=UPI003F53DF25
MTAHDLLTRAAGKVRTRGGPYHENWPLVADLLLDAAAWLEMHPDVNVGPPVRGIPVDAPPWILGALALARSIKEPADVH